MEFPTVRRRDPDEQDAFPHTRTLATAAVAPARPRPGRGGVRRLAPVRRDHRRGHRRHRRPDRAPPDYDRRAHPTTSRCGRPTGGASYSSATVTATTSLPLNANGSGLRQLTRNHAVDTTPAWSPDGRSLVFASNRAGGEHKLYVLRVDTGLARQLLEGPRTAFDIAPSWSSDGRSIAFASNRAAYANSDIWLVRRTGRACGGSRARPAASRGRRDEGTPAFSPTAAASRSRRTVTGSRRSTS